MSLLFKIIFSSACRSTHHKLVLDALRLLQGPNAELWRNLFLKHHSEYLAGAKAPDDQFKDFKNHVLHVSDNYWGGAVTTTQLWYERLVLALRSKSWPDVAYAAGVMSHYFSDPHMPFHTGQTEEEGAVHRAAEWSIACIYDELQNILEHDLGGFPNVVVPTGQDWLAKMVRYGAEIAHPHYHLLIDHYDLAKGVKNPAAGFDQEAKDRIALLLGHAAAGIARILERAFAQSNVVPPVVDVSVETFLSTMQTPVRWVTNKLKDEADRATVERIYAEVRRTGKVIENLPADERLVRKLHAEQVLKVPLEQLNAQQVRPAGMKYGVGARARARSICPNIAPTVATQKPAQPPSILGVKGKSTSSAAQKYIVTGPKARRPVVRATALAASGVETEAYAIRSSSPAVRSVPVSIRDDAREALSPPSQTRFTSAKSLSADLPPREPRSRHAESEQIPDEPRDETNERSSSDEATPTPPRRRRFTMPRPFKNATTRVRQMGRWMSDKVQNLKRRMVLSRDESPEDDEETDNKQSESADAARPERTSRTARAAHTDVERLPMATMASEDVREESTDHSSKPARTEREIPPRDNVARLSRRDNSPPRDEPLEFHLDTDSPLEDAPSIGPKLAKRFEVFGCHTVNDFLNTSAEKISTQLGIRAIDAKVIGQWQSQTKLCCRVPNLRGHDAQILVACGITDPQELADCHAQSLFELIEPFLSKPEAARILRSSQPPDVAEVTDWIRWAQSARPLQAA